MMQLSELWRRGIVIPLTTDKALEMARFSVSSESDTLYLEIDSQEKFERLWQSHLFQDINQRCACHIGNYEEEPLPPEMLKNVLEVIAEHRAGSQDDEQDDFLERLERLVARAGSLGFPVYFVL